MLRLHPGMDLTNRLPHLRRSVLHFLLACLPCMQGEACIWGGWHIHPRPHPLLQVKELAHAVRPQLGRGGVAAVHLAHRAQRTHRARLNLAARGRVHGGRERGGICRKGSRGVRRLT